MACCELIRLERSRDTVWCENDRCGGAVAEVQRRAELIGGEVRDRSADRGGDSDLVARLAVPMSGPWELCS